MRVTFQKLPNYSGYIQPGVSIGRLKKLNAETDMGVSIVMGVPPNGWFIRDNPIKMDDDWGYPYFRKPPVLFLAKIDKHDLS